MYVAITKRVEIMCQKIQCIVSKFGEDVRVDKISILIMFRVNNATTAIKIAFNLVFGFMEAVPKMSDIRRKNAAGAAHGVMIWIVVWLNWITFPVRVVGVKTFMIMLVVWSVRGRRVF